MTETLKRSCSAFVALAILLQIAWPLSHGDARAINTVLGVLAFTIVSVVHCLVNFGYKITLLLVAQVVVLTCVIEFIGVHTGLPFGHYVYGNSLGVVIGGVPVLIPLAWFMMIYPCALAARYLATTTAKQTIVIATLMTGWDFYLDPQMTRESYWTWTHSSLEVNAIPILNYVGWFASSAFIGWLALRLLARATPQWTNTIPFVMLMWIWLGGALAHAVWFSPFLNRPSVALAGFVSMGIVMIPLSRKLLKARSDA